MKKIISVLLALACLAAVFCVPVSATYENNKSTEYIQKGTTAYDMAAYGLGNFFAYKVAAKPAVDGVITAGEYPAASNVATVENGGLSVTNQSGTVDYTEQYGDSFKNFTLTSYLAYDSEYLYIAEELKGEGIRIEHVKKNAKKATYFATYLHVGMNQSPNLPEAYSSLNNGYSYMNGNDPNNMPLEPDFSAYKLNTLDKNSDRVFNDLKVSAPVSEKISKVPYTAGGVTWDLDEYAKPENQAIKATVVDPDDDPTYTYVFEYRIPLGDVARSAGAGANPAQILSQNIAYGSYMFQIGVTQQGGTGAMALFLSTGFGASRTIHPFLEDSTAPDSKWSEAVVEYWPAANEGTSNKMDYIPTPLWYVGAYDPQNPITPVTSGFLPPRPSPSKGITEVKLTGIKPGTIIPVNCTPSDPVTEKGMVLEPGDLRVVPTMWRIRAYNATQISGTFPDGVYSANINTSSLGGGRHTLVVTYSEQSWNGSAWVNTGVTTNTTHPFTINGTVKGTATKEADRTGDSVSPVLFAAGITVLCAVAFTGIVTRKKKIK